MLVGPMLALAISAQGGAFDLVCSGQTTFSDVAGSTITPLGEPSRFSSRIRIDLTSRRWCAGECTTTSEIAKISDTDIVFEQASTNVADHEIRVSRQSGEFVDTSRLIWRSGSASIFKTQAVCTRAEFSGFPNPLS